MHARHPSHARGLSLVELLVGLALGLFVVAAAATLLASQWREQHRLATESRLMQDLRSASDIADNCRWPRLASGRAGTRQRAPPSTRSSEPVVKLDAALAK